MRTAWCLIVLAGCEFSTTGIQGAAVDASPGDPADSAPVDPFGTGRDGDLIITEPTILDAYAAVVEPVPAGALVVPVDSIVGFATGDLVLLHHATGMIAASGDPAAVELAAVGVGELELVRLADVQPGELTLAAPTTHAFGPTTQAVRVAELTTLTVGHEGAVLARAWDGHTGGVIAALVTGAITLDGDVVADGVGFGGGGGGSNGGFFSCAALDGSSSDGGGAQKGAGVALGEPNGRGNVANGAGGGNCHNAGGGGGGNAGAGGTGGATWAATEPYGGLGGAAVLADDAHLVFGGGGGAGEDNADGGDGDGAGGAGGGLIWLRAGAILGEGRISASGAPGGDSRADGAGGGGAGGTIAIVTRDTLAARELRARGGKGGASDGAGSGGGGGGGWILVDATQVSAPLHVDAGEGDDQANDGADGASGRTILP